MPAAMVIGLLIAASAALVAQNLLMTRISEAASTALIALLTNSAVGLVALTALLLFQRGLSGLSETLDLFRPWSVLPGLFGSFFVFASILGYQRLGAAATISILVASQLVFGLIADALRSGPNGVPIHPAALAGAALLIAGAVLVATHRR